MSKTLTPEMIFDYVYRYTVKTVKAGKGTEWPTVGRVAKRFGVSVNDVQDVVDSYDGLDVLCISSLNTEKEEPLGKHVVEAY